MAALLFWLAVSFFERLATCLQAAMDDAGQAKALIECGDETLLGTRTSCDTPMLAPCAGGDVLRSKSSIDKPPRRFGLKAISIIAEQPTDEANKHRSNRLT